MNNRVTVLFILLLVSFCLDADEIPGPVASALNQHCADCHTGPSSKGGLDLATLTFNLDDRKARDRWVLIHDRIKKGEMPPDSEDLPVSERLLITNALRGSVAKADRADIKLHGRGLIRRLNRIEFEQNLRDLLQLPHLDIRDRLPLDRERHHCDKVSSALDMSRVQLVAYLDATETALRAATVVTREPPAVKKYRVIGKELGSKWFIAGSRKAMFFARDSKGIDLEMRSPPKDKKNAPDPSVEMALFRSPGWPYALWPSKIAAPQSGEYRVRFWARSVVQEEGYLLKPGRRSVPMTFRARKLTDHDIAEDVRSTGGILDIQPAGGVYETTVYLNQGQTIEYGLLGLPSPQIDAEGRTGYFRYPPFPAGGQPGVAFRWLEMEGPLAPKTWPPASHHVLFDNLGVGALLSSSESSGDDPATSKDLKQAAGNIPLTRMTAKRLVRRFIRNAAREPVSMDAMVPFEHLVLKELDSGKTFTEALLTGYQAFLCSDLFLYIREPRAGDDHFSVANRLSHFLTDSRPDLELSQLARDRKLRDEETLRAQTSRLIASDDFTRFVRHFTDGWLNLSELRRDQPNVRLYPEYRLDDYLVGSMGRETRAFFAAMIRDNLPARVLVDADFTFANDRLARHYGLPDVKGSALRRVKIPATSPYGGLLTQASILKVSADGTSTSPVLRGAWIMDRLVGQPPPPPPPGIPAVEPDIRGAKTIRELISQHTKAKTCASCHAQFDPVGLALESFDVLGAWRTNYRGLEEGKQVSGIDRAGHDFSYTIASRVDASGQLADGRRFQDIHGLKTILLEDSRQLARNLLQQFAIYATGMPVRFSDRQEIEDILDRCAKADYRVGDLLHELVTSNIFTGN